MKYIRLFEDRKMSPETKNGNKVARNIERLINKFVGEKYVKVDYNWAWETFKYDFEPYVFINIYKDNPKIRILSKELERLSTGLAINSVYLLTKQQIEELLISLKNGLPFNVLTPNKIDKDKIYTYIDFSRAYKNIIYNKDYITGKLFITNISMEISITGYDRNNDLRQKIIVDSWRNHIQYLREATPEEEDNYYLLENSKKYNL